MNAIGGYFELAKYENGVFPHNDGILLNTGRNALEYILCNIGDVKGVYLPYYTCDAVLEPLVKLHIPWEYYHINDCFEINEEINPNEGEYIIANNYFGLKDSYLLTLADKYKKNLIIDCAQAFFARPIPGIKAFYSPRKYLGVADGGIAYLDNEPNNQMMIHEIENTADHDSHLIKRLHHGPEQGFMEYKENEAKLRNQPIRRMSYVTKSILDHIDYEHVIEIRRKNFQFLHDALSTSNFLKLPDISSFVCPMVYPFVNNDQNLRQSLIDNKIFVAYYWPNVHQMNYYETEYDYATRLIPLPCDQRYEKKEMERILSIINKSL